MNADLLRTVNGWSGNALLDALMRFAAEDLIFLAFAGVALLCALEFTRRRLAPVVLVGASLAVAYAGGLLASVLVSEQRPFTTQPGIHQLIPHEAGQSFPSDHSLAAFGLAFATLAFLSRRWGAVLVGVAVLVGFSRVYAGVHYPGDILGSAAIAAIAVALVVVARSHVHLPVRHRVGAAG